MTRPWSYVRLSAKVASCTVPREGPGPGSAADWLTRARSDLSLASVPPPSGVLYEDLCFHAQQAAEKAIKAVNAHHGWEFRYVHDIGELLAGLRAHGLEIPDRLEEASVPTGYATGRGTRERTNRRPR
jgi:HEPN domain-containing protein